MISRPPVLAAATSLEEVIFGWLEEVVFGELGETTWDELFATEVYAGRRE